MRTLAIIAAVSGTPAPAPGIYCPISGQAFALSIGTKTGHVGVDGLDCRDAVIANGRLRAKKCFANGGSVVDYDTSLNVLADGAIVHEMEIYHRTPAGPCH